MRSRSQSCPLRGTGRAARHLEAAPRINMGGVGADERLVTPRAEERVQVLRSTVEPHGSGGDELYTVSCAVESLHVISGEVTVSFADRKAQLEAGDTVTFPGITPHTSERGGGGEPCGFSCPPRGAARGSRPAPVPRPRRPGRDRRMQPPIRRDALPRDLRGGQSGRRVLVKHDHGAGALTATHRIECLVDLIERHTRTDHLVERELPREVRVGHAREVARAGRVRRSSIR